MRTWLLRVLIGSIVVSAVSAAVALLSPEFGEVQQKTLGTTFAFSATSLNAMACATAWERRRVIGYLPVWGILVSYVVFILIAIGIWAEIDSETFFRSVATLSMSGLVAAHASLLRRVPLSREAELTGLLAIGTGVVVAAMVSAFIWRDDDPGDAAIRLLGLLAVVLAAATIAAPVVHLLSRQRGEGMAASAGAGSVSFCPRCGARLGAASGPIRCPSCGARFEVRFDA
jgi:hypothetical protein